MSSIKFDSLKDALEKKKRQGKFPARFKFETPGDEIIGKVIEIAPNPFKPELVQVEVKNVKDGVDYVLPSNVTLNNIILKGGKLHIGDYVLARFVGKTEKATRRGFFPKLYEAAVLTAEEYAEMTGGKVPVGEGATSVSGAPALQPPAQSPQVPQPTATSAPGKDFSPGQIVPPADPLSVIKTEGKPATKAEEKPAAPDDSKVKAFIDSVMSFYGKITKSDLLRLVNEVQGHNKTIDELIIIGGLKVDSKDSNYLTA